MRWSGGGGGGNRKDARYIRVAFWGKGPMALAIPKEVTRRGEDFLMGVGFSVMASVSFFF